MTKGVGVRNARMGDATALRSLTEQLGYPVSGGQIAGRLERVLSDPGHALLVAETTHKEVVGWIHGYLRTLLEYDLHIEVGGLVVSAKHRSQGIGAQLLDAVEVWGREQGARDVFVGSNLMRERAHGFYLQHGYEHVKDWKIFRKALAE